MGTLLTTGVILGLFCGILHGIDLFRRRRQVAGTPAAAYSALWAVLLWTLFGGYLLMFWLIGLVGLGIAKIWPPRRAA